MQQLFDLFLKTGLRPFAFFAETSKLEQKLTSSDVTTLLILAFRGEQTMSELASLMGAPLSTMTSIAKRLERKGLIERHPSERDQRIIQVGMTSEGSKIAVESKRLMNNMFSKIEKALTPEELEQFIHMVLKVAKVFQEDSQTEGKKETKNSVKRIAIDD
jgi:DNA-binding MarR family transcriptional regulator